MRALVCVRVRVTSHLCVQVLVVVLADVDPVQQDPPPRKARRSARAA